MDQFQISIRHKILRITRSSCTSFARGNDRIQSVLDTEIKPYLDKFDKTTMLMLSIGFERLSEINNHYARKENLLFPGLEKRGVTSIPKVMWGVDNEIRLAIKDIISQVHSVERINDKELQFLMKTTISRVEDMFVKENNIQLPLLSDTLSLYDWILADEESDRFSSWFHTMPSVRKHHTSLTMT